MIKVDQIRTFKKVFITLDLVLSSQISVLRKEDNNSAEKLGR